ncbi:MAG: LTA synthase family protein [Woeseiaceae bacterium]
MSLPFQNSRYQIILLFAVSNIVLFTLLRSILYVLSWDQIDNALFSFPAVFAVGFLYDVVFNIYFAVFFSVLLLLVPNKVYTNVIYRYLTYGFFFLFIYGLFFVLVAEGLFWEEFSVRFNFISVDYLVYRSEVTNNIYESYPILWILAVIFIASATLFKVLLPKLRTTLSLEESLKTRFTTTLSVIVLAIVCFFTLGQTLREEFSRNYAKEVASNGPYQFFAAFRNNTMDYKTFYALGEDKQLSELAKRLVHKSRDVSELYDISRIIKTKTNEKKHNVILISIESLSAKFLSRFGMKKDLTPFMDEWFKEGMLFTNIYATGTRTTRGLEAITLSVPPTPGRSIVKRPGHDHLQSIGEVFKSHGYDVEFLYGGHGYFDNMNEFYQNHGYAIVDQGTIGEKEIAFENAWGVSDEDLYNQVIINADISNKNNTPFFYHVMTTSNHRPYTYPKNRIDIPSGAGRDGAVKYTDYALQHLISEAKKHDWYDNTVFVVVADHCASSAGKVELDVDKYHIPLFIFSPQSIPSIEVDKLASQIDIAPTLLSLLDFEYKSQFWGDDIIDKDFEQRALIANYQKLGLYENDILTILSPGKKIIQVEPKNHNKSVGDVNTDAALIAKTMSYYQGAEYIYKHQHTE